MVNSSLIHIGSIQSTPLGEVWAAVSDRGLVCVEYGVPRAHFEANVHKLTRGQMQYDPIRMQPVAGQIQEYLEGTRHTFDLDIDWKLLSDFQRAALKNV